MTQAATAEKTAAPTKQAKVNGQTPDKLPSRVISDPNEVAQLV